MNPTVWNTTWPEQWPVAYSIFCFSAKEDKCLFYAGPKAKAYVESFFEESFPFNSLKDAKRVCRDLNRSGSPVGFSTWRITKRKFSYDDQGRVQRAKTVSATIIEGT